MLPRQQGTTRCNDKSLTLLETIHIHHSLWLLLLLLLLSTSSSSSSSLLPWVRCFIFYFLVYYHECYATAAVAAAEGRIVRLKNIGEGCHLIFLWKSSAIFSNQLSHSDHQEWAKSLPEHPQLLQAIYSHTKELQPWFLPFMLSSHSVILGDCWA